MQRSFLFYLESMDLRIFCDTGNSNVDVGNPVPGGKVNDTRYRKFKNGLELADGFCRIRPEDTVSGNSGNCRINACNGIKLLLNLLDLISACPNGQIIAWERGWNSGNLFSCVDVHIASVIIPENLDGRIALFP